MKESQQKSYSEGLARHKELEIEKWIVVVKSNCKASRDNAWHKDECKITDEPCDYYNCFALDVIKLAKGFL